MFPAFGTKSSIFIPQFFAAIRTEFHFQIAPLQKLWHQKRQAHAMDPPFDASIITDLLLHVIGTNLAIYYAILLAFRLHLQNIAKNQIKPLP